MARIRQHETDPTIEAPQGSSLLICLKKAQVPISTSCGGQGICGLCRLTVLQGYDLLTPVNDKEVGHIGNVAKVVHIRLACQALVLRDGDINVDIPPVVDVVARKREQSRRGFAERASRRLTPTGSEPALGRPSEPNTQRRQQTPVTHERIEWRPRKIAEAQQDLQQAQKSHHSRRPKPHPSKTSNEGYEP